jgi:hypothetical protein
MDRRFHARRACSMLLALTLLGLVFSSPARADTWNDIVDWNMSESLSQAGGGTQYHVSTGGTGIAQYRWVDSPNKGTVVSANYCTDLNVHGSVQTIGIGDTNYHTLFSGGSQGECFVVQGHVQYGQGSMVNHDGRISR